MFMGGDDRDQHPFGWECASVITGRPKEPSIRYSNSVVNTSFIVILQHNFKQRPLGAFLPYHHHTVVEPCRRPRLDLLSRIRAS